MSSLAYSMSDSVTMVRRNVRHTVRYPITLMMTIGMPTVMLLLFVVVFGGALGAGVHGVSYIDYLLPGILLMTVGYGSSSTATSVNSEMTEGIIDRFRTMAISRSSVLTGYVVGALLRTLAGVVLMIGVALLMGFRSSAGPLAWLGTVGLMLLVSLALTWPAVAVGLLAKSVQGTTPFVLIAQMLPFLSSAFVPTGSMSAVVRWFAHYEPFTPITDTMRGLLLGTPIGTEWITAVAWCAGVALAGYLWARSLFTRGSNR